MVLRNFNLMNFSKVLLKFAFVFKVFELFCPFTIISDQRRFSSHVDELLDITPETKIVLKILTAKSGSLFKIFAILGNFFKISFFYLLKRLENYKLRSRIKLKLPSLNCG